MDTLHPCYEDLPSFALNHGTYDENKPILIDTTAPHRVITKALAKGMVERTARGLQAIGLQQGDTVCVVHLNDTMYPVVFLAIIMAGGRFSGANPSYTAGELRHHIEVSETKFIISDLASLSAVSEASQGLVDAINIIIWDESETGAGSGRHHSLVAMMAGLPFSPLSGPLLSFNDETPAKNTVAALMSTSGTTGLPKMAARSHSSWVTENLALQDKVAKPYEVVRLLFTPFFHGFTAPLALVDALRSGHTTYIMPRFHLKSCLECIERYKITELAAPPPVLLSLMQLAEHDRKALRSVRLIWSGGAPMSATIQNAALAMFHPEARIVQVYGMTEGGWMTTFKHPERDLSGSVGRLLPSCRAKITDSNGNDITSSHSPGLLHVKGPINMLGYLNNPAATDDTLQDGWLCTGDIGFFAQDNKLHITDRQKDIIKVRGWQVSPTELEACLLCHALVSDAGVFGHHNSSTDAEIPVAHVVLRAGIPDSLNVLQDLVKHCYDNLAKYKVNDLEIRFKRHIPKNPAGKILRRELKADEMRYRFVQDWLANAPFEAPEEEEVVWELLEWEEAKIEEARLVEQILGLTEV